VGRVTTEPLVPEPDDKDWTWTITQRCPDCGYDGPAVARADVPRLTRDAVAALAATLARPDATQRPAPDVWSPLEYACHVRDVCRVFLGRLQLMLSEDDPQFPNWDQDATALEERYWAQDPAVVRGEMAEAGARIADEFAAVSEDQWLRTARRSNGSVFTVDTIARYFLHDLVHHVYDVGA
jgi:hypothetical protein